MMKAPRGPALSAPFALLAACSLAACFLDTAGVDPVSGEINFPTSIVMAPPRAPGEAPAYVYVVNSNFDLSYNGGTVMAIDVAAVASALARPECAAPCVLPQSPGFVAASHEVVTGSFPGGAAISTDGRRLYAPFRSDSSLTFIDVDPVTGSLSCQVSGATGGRCDDFHRRGDETIASRRGESMPGDPSRVLLHPLPNPADGDFLVVLDRGGKASLFFDRPSSPNVAPTLIDVVDGLPASAVGLAYDDVAGITYVSSANTTPTARLARVGVALDEAAGAEASYLYRAGEPRISGLDDGLDVRDLAFDGDRLYLLSRRPQAVVFIDLRRAGLSSGDLPIERVISVDFGASRLKLATIGTRKFLFVTCYDGRTLFVIDAETGAVEDVVRGFSGPFEVAVDEVRALAFVSDFRSSVVRVVDLAPLREGTSEPLLIVATIGVERAPSELN